MPMKIRIKVFPLENSPGYLIYRSITMMKAELLRTFREKGFDVTPEQWSVLNKLWEFRGLNQMELAEKTSKDRHTMTRILTLMERKKLILRKADRRDNRCYKIYLTPKGKGLKNKLNPLVIRLLKKAFAGFRSSDMEGLKRMHEDIIRNLGKDPVPGHGTRGP